MGFVSSLFSGNKGMGWQAGGTNIAAPQTPEQVQAAQKAAQQAQAEQAAFVQALKAQGGQGMATQTALTGQLEDVAAGRGPNPAMAALTQATGQNVENTAALMAGQRGASQNVGQIARGAAQQGAKTQQAAVGQGATLQAQQAIQAQQQLKDLAATQLAQTQTGLTTEQQTALSQQQLEQQQLQAQNAANVAMQSNINSANAGVQQQIAGQQGGLFSNLMGAVGSGIGMLVGGGGGGAAAAGGMGGGDVPELTMPKLGASAGFAHGGAIPAHPFVAGWISHQNSMAKGGKVPTMVSPGEIYLPPEKLGAVASGKANPRAVGQKIPGKARVSGDSYQNDTVPRKLEVGGVVLPRSVVNAPDARQEAQAFVREVQARKHRGSKR